MPRWGQRGELYTPIFPSDFPNKNTVKQKCFLWKGCFESTCLSIPPRPAFQPYCHSSAFLLMTLWRCHWSLLHATLKLLWELSLFATHSIRYLSCSEPEYSKSNIYSGAYISSCTHCKWYWQLKNCNFYLDCRHFSPFFKIISYIHGKKKSKCLSHSWPPWLNSSL